MKSKEVIIPHGEKVFVITYTAGQEDYTQNIPQLAKSLLSLKFL